MAKWTLEQVVQWLEANGFEKYVQNFIEQEIDGSALMGLREGDIIELLAVVDESGTRVNASLQTRRRFLAKLEECRTPANGEQARRTRRSSAKLNDLAVFSKAFLVEPTSIRVKFVQSELICAFLTKYLSETFGVQCHIPPTAVSMQLKGVKENVQNAHHYLQSLFATVNTQVLDEEHASGRVIKWSKNIYCDAVLLVLQQIFLDKGQYTVWEKTSPLSGYYIVHHLANDLSFIDQVMNNEIAFAKGLTLSNTSKKCRSELDELINQQRNEQERKRSMVIICALYPFQTELQISLFGLKEVVRAAKKQFNLLINRHRTRTIHLKLDLQQREYLVDNCIPRLRTIELDHADDNVKIPIRENLFIAPQYLMKTIRQLIYSMLFQTSNLTFKSIPNAFVLTDKDRAQLEALARNFHCQIEDVRVQTVEESITLPKGKLPPALERLTKEPNEFSSPLFVPKVISIAKNTLEVRKSGQIEVDLTILSTMEGGDVNMFDLTNQNGYLQSKTGEKLLYQPWVPPQQKKLNESIQKFISSSLGQLVQHKPKTVAFSTANWENYPFPKPFIEAFVREMKSQLAAEPFSECQWRIILPFNEKQRMLFKMFSNEMAKSPIETTSNGQFSCPISTITIVLKTTVDQNIVKCHKAIDNYIDEHVFATVDISQPFSPEIWDQQMINDFYSYCLKESVLLDFLPTRLQLTGPVKKLALAKEKYELMARIAQLKILPAGLKSNEKSDRCNILISYCSADEALSQILADCLMDEGYLVAMDALDHKSPTLKARMNKTDIVLICFTATYYNNPNAPGVVQAIKQLSRKKIVPVVLQSNASEQENDWLDCMDTEEFYYEVLGEEIKFKLNEEFDLNYERLLIDLLQETKPGAMGQTYPRVEQSAVAEPLEDEKTDRPNAITQFTEKEREAKKRAYDKHVQRIIQRERIPDDDLNDLLASLTVVLEGPHDTPDEQESSERSQASDDEQQEDPPENDSNDTQTEREREIPLYILQPLFSQIERWMAKTADQPPIKGNLPPFVLTGDYNDALFPIPLPDKLPWWEVNKNDQNVWHSKPKDPGDFSEPEIVGSWFNHDEAHYYYSKFLDRDIQFQRGENLARVTSDDDKKQSAPKPLRVYAKFDTSVKHGVPAWGADYDVQLVKEYRWRTGETATELPDNFLQRWHFHRCKHVKQIGYLVHGRVELPRKTEEKCRERERLDDPYNELWTKGLRDRRCPDFVAMKRRNIIEWEKFLDAQEGK